MEKEGVEHLTQYYAALSAGNRLLAYAINPNRVYGKLKGSGVTVPKPCQSDEVKPVSY